MRKAGWLILSDFTWDFISRTTFWLTLLSECAFHISANTEEMIVLSYVSGL